MKNAKKDGIAAGTIEVSGGQFHNPQFLIHNS